LLIALVLFSNFIFVLQEIGEIAKEKIDSEFTKAWRKQLTALTQTLVNAGMFECCLTVIGRHLNWHIASAGEQRTNRM
jgi:hypothetical protein